MGEYSLAIKFLSNERPWSTVYPLDHPTPIDDADAIKRARGMAEGMGREYAVVLLKHGVHLPMEGRADG